MIFGSLAHSERIESLHPAFKQVFDYIKSHDLLNAPLERIVLDGDNLFINNVLTQGKKEEDQPLEAHKAYLDIHILLQGKERIGYKNIDETTNPLSEFNEDDDYVLFGEPATAYVDLLPCQFAIVYPEDAHAPLIGEGDIRKLIVKARV